MIQIATPLVTVTFFSKSEPKNSKLVSFQLYFFCFRSAITKLTVSQHPGRKKPFTHLLHNRVHTAREGGRSIRRLRLLNGCLQKNYLISWRLQFLQRVFFFCLVLYKRVFCSVTFWWTTQRKYSLGLSLLQHDFRKFLLITRWPENGLRAADEKGPAEGQVRHFTTK